MRSGEERRGAARSSEEPPRARLMRVKLQAYNLFDGNIHRRKHVSRVQNLIRNDVTLVCGA